MADLKDLKNIGEDLLPIFKQLFELIKTGRFKGNVPIGGL